MIVLLVTGDIPLGYAFKFKEHGKSRSSLKILSWFLS